MREVRYLPHYTYEDYRKWQGDWELIDGIPVALASPKYIHQAVLLNLATLLKDALEGCPECVVALELDYIVSHDTVLRPDISILCEEVEDYIRKAPLLIAEVVSESTAERDEGIKKDIYEREGVGYYLIVYPESKIAKVYRNTERGFIKLKDAGKDRMSFDLGECRLEVDFSKVWHFGRI